jgi:multiple sugar transport system substrate-binding protein
MHRAACGLALLILLLGCGGGGEEERAALVVSGSAVGAEGEILARHVQAFMAANPGIPVVVQSTPDDANQRHQLYVQWLNARVGTPDVLQLDVAWTPELAAAGWIAPLDRFGPRTDDFFPAALAADTWRGRLYALPWFMDVGMLYWRTEVISPTGLLR